MSSSLKSETVINISGVSKVYHVYDQPIDRLKQALFPRLLGFFGLQPKKSYCRNFISLEDVSFNVAKGETVGIVGRNGAGKSTLLQIICGTLTPTSGTVEVNGKVAALLELGAGFNPEFTGRENVYMNASILGLTEEQINERYDSIVEFADIGDYLDQPVKTYSSGMYVRLAFAVIAHVDADILVIDEALAVGDAIFTQKCMRFIRKFQQTGTLIFVSHDLSSVQNLCESAIWLHKGQTRMSGSAKYIAEEYLQYSLQEAYAGDAELESLGPSDNVNDRVALEGEGLLVENNLAKASGWKTGGAEIIGINIEIADETGQKVIEGGELLALKITAEASIELDQPILGFIVKDRLGQDLFGENTLDITTENPINVLPGQTFFAQFEFNLPMLPNGQYSIMVSVANGDRYDNIQHHYVHDAMVINVLSSKVRYGLVGIPFERVNMEVLDK
jgi:lipopolysaccharide transport system ATP-binding protein